MYAIRSYYERLVIARELHDGVGQMLVVLRMEKDLLFKEKRSYMVMVDGVLRGRLNAADENGVYLEVALPNATTRLQAQPNGGEAVEFRRITSYNVCYTKLLRERWRRTCGRRSGCRRS